MFKRYNDPVVLINTLIQSGQLHEFLMNMVKEREQEELKDVYLRRVYDKSFDEFVKEYESNKNANEMSQDKVAQIKALRKSQKMLNAFKLDEIEKGVNE